MSRLTGLVPAPLLLAPLRFAGLLLAALLLAGPLSASTPQAGQDVDSNVPGPARQARAEDPSTGQEVEVDDPRAGQEVEPTPAVPAQLDGVPYRSLSGARVRVWSSPGDSLVAERVLLLLEGQPPLPGLPDTLPSGVNAVLAHSPAAFDELTGGVVPEWRAGVAIPSVGMLVMPTGEGVRVVDGEGLRTLRHEWAHLGLHGHLGTLRVPRWFDEGYAQWASGGFDASGAWRLRVLIAAGRAPAMDSLTLGWPREREAARTAYLLAASAVTYLLEAGGEAGLELFLERWRTGRSFERAFRETFGLTTSQFEEDWKRHVKRRYGWLFVLSRSSVFWLFLALVLLFMVRTRQGRNREKLARLRAGELPDEPAFWEVRTGPPRPPASDAAVPGASPSPPDRGPEDPDPGVGTS